MSLNVDLDDIFYDLNSIIYFDCLYELKSIFVIWKRI